MKCYVRCPVCDHIMLIEYQGYYNIIKSCKLRLNHSITFTCNADTDEVTLIVLYLPESKMAQWDFFNRKFRIIDKFGVSTELPWFEPNMFDYKKLINKINTYVLFS